MAIKENLTAQYELPRIRSGNYEAQRQLDFRLVHGHALRIVSPLEQAAHRLKYGEERDFQIAMQRRKEPVGLTLKEMGKKYGL
jgi:hypothetical protein